MTRLVAVADLEGVRGVHSNPPLEPNYFIFMGKFKKIWMKIGKRTPLGKFEPPFRKSWIRHWVVTLNVKSENKVETCSYPGFVVQIMFACLILICLFVYLLEGLALKLIYLFAYFTVFVLFIVCFFGSFFVCMIVCLMCFIPFLFVLLVCFCLFC